MKKIVVLFAIIIILIALPGCKTHIHLPILWYGPGTAWETFDVTIAVASDGAKHVIYSNCDYQGHCYLDHERTYQGGAHSLMHLYDTEVDRTPSVPYYRFPDISVGTDAKAYFVWHYKDHNGYYYDCWNYIEADNSPHNGLCNKLQDPGQYSPENSYPKVIAYSDVAYAVYEVDEGGGNRSLYYRQLNPLDASHGLVSGIGGGSSANPSLAVSTYTDEGPVHVLHVAWANNGGNASSKTVYNNNYGTNGNMTNQRISADVGARADPVIAITGEPKTVYILYRLDSTPDKLALLYLTSPTWWSVMIGVPDLLSGVGNWELVNRPDITADEDEIFIAYTGMNDTTRAGTSFQELFTASYKEGGSIPISYTRITNNSTEEGDPRIVFVGPPEGIPNNIPVVAWRNNPDPGYYRDVYLFYNIIGGIETVAISPDGIGGGFYDFAANGDNVAGIFIDQASSTNPIHNPWFTFNDFPGYLPLLKKP